MNTNQYSIIKTGAYIIEMSFTIFDSSLEIGSLLNFHSKQIIYTVRHHLITPNYQFCAFDIAI